MKKLQFTVSINAPAAKVYDYMLGITSKATYEQWTSLFNPTLPMKEAGTREVRFFLLV